MPYDLRPVAEAEAERFVRAVYAAFGEDYPKDEKAELERLLATVPMDRTLAAFDGDTVVGTLANIPFTLRVPGGDLPMAGTTMVTVQSTHRRQGIQRAIMTSHLEDARAHGEPIAGLWTSETPIYGRYGYGNAHDRCEVEIDASAVDVAGAGTGSIRFVELDEALETLPAIYDRATRRTPGALSRSSAWWRWETLYDHESRRHGMSRHRIAVRRGEDGDDGYVVYRQREKWEGFVARGKLTVEELVAGGPGAHGDLWGFVTNVDLFPVVDYWNLPTEDELPWRVTDPRKLRRKLWDGLWLRVLDVGAVLTARRYPADGRLTLGLSDPLFADVDGSYELEVSDGSARCRRTESEPDLALGIESLGALVLGGRRSATLARAGRVSGSDEALRIADSMFGWHVAPWCPEVF